MKTTVFDKLRREITLWDEINRKLCESQQRPYRAYACLTSLWKKRNGIRSRAYMEYFVNNIEIIGAICKDASGKELWRQGKI